MDEKTVVFTVQGEPRSVGPWENGDEVSVEPWTNGWAVGFKVTCNGVEQYVYLNPSGGGDSPDVFVYCGKAGHPAEDDSICFISFEGSHG